jgi:hypothetical protein
MGGYATLYEPADIIVVGRFTLTLNAVRGAPPPMAVLYNGQD